MKEKKTPIQGWFLLSDSLMTAITISFGVDPLRAHHLKAVVAEGDVALIVGVGVGGTESNSCVAPIGQQTFATTH